MPSSNIQTYPFWYGGKFIYSLHSFFVSSANMCINLNTGLASAVACFATHPLDLAKVRLQASSKVGDNLISVIIRIITHEGFFSVYSGLSAALLRQGTYSLTRFGIYEKAKELSTQSLSRELSGLELLSCSIIAGTIGSIVGNPSDIVNVRMQNDGSLCSKKRRNYRNCFDGLYKICKYEGPMSLFRGLRPNIVRGILMTSSQVVSYDLTKRLLVDIFALNADSKITHFSASLAASLMATTVCSPADVIKTRIMNSSALAGNTFAIMFHSIKNEGVKFMFRGWVPSFVRLGPQTILTLLGMEQLKKWKVGVR